MRTTRTLMAGLVAGLGTTGTMVASAACLFFAASTVIAFNSWSNSSISDRVESLFVGDNNPSAAFEAPGPQAVATSAGATAAVVARAPRPTPGRSPLTGTGRGDGVRGLGSSPVRDGPSDIPPSGGDASGAQPGVPDTGPPRAPHSGGTDLEATSMPADIPATLNLGGVVQNTTDTLTGTVEQTTGQLGSTLGGVSQPLGDVVTSTGQTLGGTISYTGQTLNGVLNGGR